MKDSLDTQIIVDFVQNSFEFLSSYAENFRYWHFECAGGVFAMQVFEDQSAVVVLGNQEANLGDVRATLLKFQASA